MKLAEIASKLNCDVRGDGEVEINGAAGIEEAKLDEITFISNPKYVSKLKDTGAGAVILSPEGPSAPIPTLLSSNPYLTFALVLELFYSVPVPIPGIHPTASIADSAELGEGHSVGANVVIGHGARIGEDAILHPNVVIYPYAEIGDNFEAHSNSVVREHCKIGNGVILQNAAIIGADGFGFAPQEDTSYYKIVQSGIVVLEDDVEVGANACVDRATVGETRIQKGTKIDNLVQIGHGSIVGQDTVLAAQVGLAGSSRVGDNVIFAGQVGVAGHLTIGDRVVATAQTGIARSVETGKRISGTPEMDSNLWKKNYLLMFKFPELVRTVRSLEKRIAQLEGTESQD
jgi:UDP-3-O-[3-hydroxymyristoyl] glucosamine N-acyltransferase